MKSQIMQAWPQGQAQERPIMYQVTVLPSARRFSVLPDETILNAAIREGVGLPYSCRDGTCGSCKSKLVSGTVALRDYSDSALSIEEKMPAVSCRAALQ